MCSVSQISAQAPADVTGVGHVVYTSVKIIRIKAITYLEVHVRVTCVTCLQGQKIAHPWSKA